MSQTRQYAVDQGGLSRVCTVPTVSVADGKETPVAMSMNNDRGHCAISVAQGGSRPFDAGLVKLRPQHGKVYVHTVGDMTRIDYTPDAGFAGADAFTVAMVPGGGSLKVSVTVTK